MKTINYFNYEKELTNEDIIRYAKIIAQASKEISEIEEAKKRLRELKETIERHSKYIQEGKIVSLYQGEFEWHKPVQNCVTISSPTGRFPAFLRDMTPEEIKEHSQLEIPFDNTVEQVTDMIVEAAKDAGFEEPEESFFGPTENYTPDYVEGNKQGRKQYFILPTKNVSFPWVLWLQEFDEEGKILDNSGLFWGSSREEVTLKLQSLMWNLETSHGDEEEDTRTVSIDDDAASLLDQIDYENYDPGTFVPEEETNLGVQITTENEEIQEQEEAILNVDRDKVNIFKSVINNKYFMLDDFGERLYLTIERMSQSQIYFQDPAVQKGTILKDRKDIPLVDLPKKTMAGRTDQIPVYKSLRDGTYFLLDNEGKRLPLEVLIDADTTVTFIDPFDKGQFLVKSPEDIQLRDEEPEQLSKVKVWKALNGGYFVFNEQQDPVPLKVLNSLENVVFLEQEGVEGVILKRHSEIIPSGIYL